MVESSVVIKSENQQKPQRNKQVPQRKKNPTANKLTSVHCLLFYYLIIHLFVSQ